jgi:uncharacterized repeat protein (TIGR01451 family)
MKLHLPIALFLVLATSLSGLRAQSGVDSQIQADIDKIANPVIVADLSHGSRSDAPGSDCAHAIPLVDGQFFFLPTINSNLSNIINQNNQSGFILSSCLGSAPNQTWFEFTAADTGGVTILIQGQADYDYIFLDATNFPCEQFDVFDGSSGIPQTLNCSYSTSGMEQINNVIFPGRRYILVVTNYSNVPAPFMMQVFSSGNVIPVSGRIITGQVYSDVNNNCVFDGGDNPIQNSQASLVGTIIYDIADADGVYRLLMPASQEGTVMISNGSTSGLLWENLCPEQEPLISMDFGASDTIVANVAYSSIVECPLPSVNTSVPFLRRCFTSPRTVQYCNLGTLPVLNAEITLRYDQGVNPVSITVPYSFDGTFYRFPVGDLAIGACGSFVIIDSVGCENGINSFGCVEAEIGPVENCLSLPAGWDNSDLDVTATCIDSTTASFTVTNSGTGNMSMSMPYEVKRNGQFEDSGMLLLAAGQSQTFTYSNNNDLVTFAATETEGNPFNTIAWALSDCNSAINFGGTSPEYALADNQPWLDIDCDRIIGAYDPNDKFAWPFGTGNQWKIERTDNLEYRIRFQNTGNDTAFTVVVIDTLSDKLNLETLRFTGNSHSYTYELVDRVLTVRFDQIALPDSATNLAGSIGYFRFMIDQVEDNPANYVIENFADIYFDFNPPIRTNTEYRSVGEVALIAANEVNTSFDIYPVPASDLLNVQLNTNTTIEISNVQVTDLSGRMIESLLFKGNKTQLNITELKAGIYFVSIINSNGIKSSQKLVVVR